MSGFYEQKYLLYNWSDCRYRNRPQSPRAVLSIRLARAIAPKRTISSLSPARTWWVIMSSRVTAVALSGKTGFSAFFE
jgi:hypothetical protein